MLTAQNEIYTSPAVLQWARNTMGYSQEEIVEKLKEKKVTLQVFQQWEAGDNQPSYAQLKKLAKFYKRPVALFFFPTPPSEIPIEESFRSLPSATAKEIPPEIRSLVREAKVQQINLQELHGNARRPTRALELKTKVGESAKQLADRMRSELSISVEAQSEWKDDDTALKKWRIALEELDIWVFKDAFKNDDYCGFCVYDEQYPVIYINNSQSKTRQIFTLFHELGHLLRGKAGIDFRRATDYKGAYEVEEEFCNSFAGIFLIPEEILEHYTEYPGYDGIKKLAVKYKVSFEVILRKFLNKNMISSDKYRQIIDDRERQYQEMKAKRKNKSGGGNFYATQKSYLGDKYIGLALGEYYNQRISQEQLADYLNVPVKGLDRLEGLYHGYS